MATAELYDGDWLNTGDLGYMAKGELYVTGREKDLIIRAGRNIFPSELENEIGKLEGVYRNNVAIFSSTDLQSGSDNIIVLAESRFSDEQNKSILTQSIIKLSSQLIGLAPDDIVIAPPRSVPKTSSGKIRRHAARSYYQKRYLNGGVDFQKFYLFTFFLEQWFLSFTRSFKYGLDWIYATYFWTLAGSATLIGFIGLIAVPSIRFRWKLLRFLLYLVRRLAGIKISFEGFYKHESFKTTILVANHASYIDGALLICALTDHFSFVAKSELKDYFLVKLFLEKIGTLFVERFDKRKSLIDASLVTKKLKAGSNIIFFPEGTFTRMPGLQPFRMGAFITAIEAEADIVPVVLCGNRSLLRGDTWFPRRTDITIKFLDRISINSDEFKSNWEAAVSLREIVRERMLSKCEEPDLKHEMAFQELEAKVT
ncbi:MAG: 1-acyl-sn-glycerol-3-phosphate acyltransferase [Pseudomonadota bacterium]|nr:1-acyl-sn-glycerol-3-phosphate acyltransferase [Pseudomonadota bacterium]